jgi:hypothetical protein
MALKLEVSLPAAPAAQPLHLDQDSLTSGKSRKAMTLAVGKDRLVQFLKNFFIFPMEKIS